MELIKENSERFSDFNEQNRRVKLLELEEKEKLLQQKKIYNEKILKYKEYYKIEMEKQKKLQENYEEENKTSEKKVKLFFIAKFYVLKNIIKLL